MARKKKALPLLENVKIEAVAAEGKALARVRYRKEDENPIVVFVPYAAPGDIVDIQVDRKKHSFAEAHIDRIVLPSANRIEPVCEHFGICGGCKWQHLPYSEQLYWKHRQIQDALNRIAKVPVPEIEPTLGSANIWNYRNKMEYTFSNKKWRTWEQIRSGQEFTDSANALGFHIPGAFDKVLHIESCHLQDSKGNEVRNFIYSFALSRGLSFYDIRNNSGLLRTLMIRIATTADIMVCISFGEDDKEGIEEVMNAVGERFPEITSLQYVVNLKLNDSISDQDVVLYRGKDYIEEKMEGLVFRINAKSFYQTNSLQAYELYKVVRRFAGLENTSIDSEATDANQHSDDGAQDAKPLVYDLYTGAGTIANFVARRAHKVIGIEYVPEAIEDAKLNSEANGIENTLFFAGDMKDVLTDGFIAEHGRPDVMIVDPPRAGMHEDVVKVILNASAPVLVYVSCNPATQARDLALLDERYRITDVQPVDMFPHTHHVENVVRLELKS